MAVSPARSAAFDILLRVSQGAYAAELLHSHRLNALSPQDRALCTELVMGVERWRSRLDDALALHLKQPLAKLDAEVLLALRLGTYQLLFLDRVPARAAIHESVELAKRARKRSASGLVNATLRNLTRYPPPPPSSAPGGTPLSCQFAHPEWLVNRWIERYGVAPAAAICEYDQRIPATAIRLRGTDDAELAAEGLELSPGALMAGARRVMAGDVTQTRAFTEQRIGIQDEASQLVAALVGGGNRILDCCAAPGGKTAAIADRNPNAVVVAVDIHEHRTRTMQSLVKNPNVTFLTADARQLRLTQEFDRILVDAPCSGTGTLARNPEIKWRLQPADLAELHQRQLELLIAAAGQAAAGARLVYATCSLEPEEGEQVVAQALERCATLRLTEMRTELDRLREARELSWPDVASLVQGKFLRTIPGMHPCDGFFAAVLRLADS